MKKILVIGGGFAGLASSVFLSSKNFKITLLESSPKLGGRAFSILNKNQNSFYDNGQHILMGCYEETLEFLSLINSINQLEIPSALSINFVRRGGELIPLKASPKFYPFNLLKAILTFKGLRTKSRIKIIDFFLDLLCCYSCDLKNKNVLDWLKEKRQTEEAIKFFWEILVVGALNTTIEKASAQIFAETLKRIFFSGNMSSTILVAKGSLNELYIEPAVRFLIEKGSEIILSEKVKKFECIGNRITKVVTEKNIYNDFEFVLSALPIYALDRILKNSNIENYQLPDLKYSPILNVHLWLKMNPFKERFYGLMDSLVHWVFNRDDHISITISSAEELFKYSDKKILDLIYSDLEIFFPIFKSSLVKDFKIIKEKRATFIPNVDSIYEREKLNLPLDNLLSAGDWTNIFLPATIESAVLSAKNVSEKF